MTPQIITAGHLRLILIHPARLWVRSATTAAAVQVYHHRAKG